MTTVRTLIAVLTLSLLTGAACAQSIWKWKDKDGRIQISDRAPPISVPEKDILSRPAGTAAPIANTSSTNDGADAPPAAVASGVDTALEAQRRKVLAEQASAKKSQQAVEEAKQAALKADNCQRAKSQLALLESGQRMTRPNLQGEREFLDDRARADEVKRMHQVMDSSCR
jgi:hypothetical protein